MEDSLNREAIIVLAGCLLAVTPFILFKTQLFILLSRLTRINVRGAKNIKFSDQDENLEIDQDIKLELPKNSWIALPLDKFTARIIIFIIFSFLIYILLSSFSRILVQFGNVEFSAGHEKAGIAAYNLALAFNENLKEAVSKCLAYNTQKQYETAITHCNKAIEINENYISALLIVGFLIRV